jgi:hypothetical protein
MVLNDSPVLRLTQKISRTFTDYHFDKLSNNTRVVVRKNLISEEKT